MRQLLFVVGRLKKPPLHLSRENGVQESPQTFLNPEIKNRPSSEYAQSATERIPNRPAQKELRQFLFVGDSRALFSSKQRNFSQLFVALQKIPMPCLTTLF